MIKVVWSSIASMRERSAAFGRHPGGEWEIEVKGRPSPCERDGHPVRSKHRLSKKRNSSDLRHESDNKHIPLGDISRNSGRVPVRDIESEGNRVMILREVDGFHFYRFP